MSSEENIIATPADNSIAADAISAKLIEVSQVAESLDVVLHETQDGLSVFEASTSLPFGDRKSSANNSDVSNRTSRCLGTRSTLLIVF